jgi:transcription initiation factor IIE alpha subunit
LFLFQPLQLALAKVGVEKGVFEILAAAKREGKVLANAELANKAGIDPALLKRILRYWESLGTISQPEEDAYTANNVTEALASVQGRTAIIHK